MRGISFAAVVMSLILSACTAAAPTVDPLQVQASAVAGANTMVALTQAAIPTATPIPPTPLPSPTAPPSPTSQALPTLSTDGSPTVEPTSGNTGTDPCNAPMSSSPTGPLTTLKIDNGTKAPVTVSIYLYKTKFGECGYRGYNLGPLDSVYLTDLPQGCYSAFALVNDPKKPSKAFSTQLMCPNNDDKWTMVVQADVIKFYSP